MRLPYIGLPLLAVLAARPVLADSFSALRMDTWQLGDEQTSIVYSPDTGELSVDPPASTNLTSINIDSAGAFFIADNVNQDSFGGSFDTWSADNLFKATFGDSFGGISLGVGVLPPGLSNSFVANDLSVTGSLEGGGGLGDVDCCYLPEPSTFVLTTLAMLVVAGCAMRNKRIIAFGLLVCVAGGQWCDKVHAGKCPPERVDSFAALIPGAQFGDEQTSIFYNVSTGELIVDPPASTELTAINIDSAAGIFTSHENAENLDGTFDTSSEDNIFKATFGDSFGSISFGNVAVPGLSEEFVLHDLTVTGALAGGGGLGDVDLWTCPEPSTSLLTALGLLSLISFGRRMRQQMT